MASAAIKSVPLAWGLSSLPLIIRAVIVKRQGNLDNTNPRDRKAQEAGLDPAMQQVCTRLLNSHINQLETLGYYAAGVAIAVAVRVPPETLTKLTGLFIKSRIAFNIAYAAPQIAGGYMRTAAFLTAMTSIALIYFAAAESVTSLY